MSVVQYPALWGMGKQLSTKEAECWKKLTAPCGRWGCGGPFASASAARVCRASCVSLQHCIAVTSDTTLCGSRGGPRGSSRRGKVDQVYSIPLLHLCESELSQMNLSGKWKRRLDSFGLCDVSLYRLTLGEKKLYFLTRSWHPSSTLLLLTIMHVGRKSRVQNAYKGKTVLLSFHRAKCFWSILDANKIQLC